MESQAEPAVDGSPGHRLATNRKALLTLGAVAAVSAGVWFAIGLRSGSDSTHGSKRGAANVPQAPGEVWRSKPQYVGSEACRSCHADQFASYAQTAHSRALETIDLQQEPPDAVFDHPESGFRFRAKRVDGHLVHEASLLLHDGSELGRVAHELAYRVGSGHHSRTYLAKSEGLLFESPITWWENWHRWSMSPGYDRAVHPGFNRTINVTCLSCHSGNVETSVENDFHLRPVELAIGCERCHGPGRRHLDLETAASRTPGASDDAAHRAIVNPARLSRAKSEAICQQCHKQADIQVPGFGVRTHEFQPGEALEKYRQEYRVQEPHRAMEIVEHSEQLAHSACYMKSETLSCLTCHNPHVHVPAAERVEHYRTACLACHQDQSCRVPLADRTERSQNNCASCHMPKNPTIMPHIAFTHHQIGIHPLKPADVPAADADRLVPLFDLAALSERDRQRSLGLAWHRVFLNEGPWKQTLRQSQESAERAENLLTTLPAEYQDDTVWGALAELLQRQGELAKAEAAARHVLDMEATASTARIQALKPLSVAAFEARRFGEAAEYFGELTKLRRYADDWFKLGLCEHECGFNDAAIESLTKAIELNLRHVQARQLLAHIHHARKSSDEEQRLLNEIDRLTRDQAAAANPSPER